MNRELSYQLELKWTGNTGIGNKTYTSYERSHEINFKNKPLLKCSSDPHFRGNPNLHNPEDLLLSAISSCHMLWYLHLCSEAGIIVMDYVDHAIGIMTELENGSGHFKEVTLKPQIVITDLTRISEAKALHQKANEMCFIANSCNFPVYHNPTFIEPRQQVITDHG